MKIYSKKEVAEQIAASMNKGLDDDEPKVGTHAHKGGFVVCTQAVFDTMGEEAQAVPVDTSAKVPATGVPPKPPAPSKPEEGDKAPAAAEEAPKKPKKAKAGQVACKAVITGGFLKGAYVYTPKIAGKSRWFAVKDVVSATEVEGGVEVVATEAAFTKRGIEGYEPVAA